MSSTGDPPVSEREGLEIALREFLDEDDAVSAVQLMLANGWRHPNETARAWTDLGTAMTRLAGAWLEVEGALATYRVARGNEKVWGPERMRHDPERTEQKGVRGNLIERINRASVAFNRDIDPGTLDRTEQP